MFSSQAIKLLKQRLRVLCTALVIYPLLSRISTVYAASQDSVQVSSASDILANIASQLPSVMRLVTAVAFVLGMYFIIAGIIKLKHYGEQRSMMSVEHSLVGPMVYFAIGALLLYLPSAVNTGMSTFWSSPNPYGYLEKADQWNALYKDCFMVIQLFGTIAFIRGLVILSRVGGHGGGGHDSLGKGLTHIIGGILCINIYQFVQVILNTMGISISGFNS